MVSSALLAVSEAPARDATGLINSSSICPDKPGDENEILAAINEELQALVTSPAPVRQAANVLEDSGAAACRPTYIEQACTSPDDLDLLVEREVLALSDSRVSVEPVRFGAEQVLLDEIAALLPDNDNQRFAWSDRDVVNQIIAELNLLLDDDGHSGLCAKSHTISTEEKSLDSEESRGFEDARSEVCPVVDNTLIIDLPIQPITSEETSLTESAKLYDLRASLKATQSPLHHLFGYPDHPFKLCECVPSSTWDRSVALEKYRQAIRSAQSRNGVAFSLNLSDRRIRALLKSDDATARLSHELNRAMVGSLGQVLPYAFQFEFSPQGRLHVHGVVCLPEASKIELELVGDALVKAGGKIKGREGSTQLKCKELYFADGWITYMAKTARATVRGLLKQDTASVRAGQTVRVWHVSRSLNAFAKDDWNAAFTRSRPRLVA